MERASAGSAGKSAVKGSLRAATEEVIRALQCDAREWCRALGPNQAHAARTGARPPPPHTARSPPSRAHVQGFGDATLRIHVGLGGFLGRDALHRVILRGRGTPLHLLSFWPPRPSGGLYFLREVDGKGRRLNACPCSAGGTPRRYQLRAVFFHQQTRSPHPNRKAYDRHRSLPRPETGKALHCSPTGIAGAASH